MKMTVLVSCVGAVATVTYQAVVMRLHQFGGASLSVGRME